MEIQGGIVNAVTKSVYEKSIFGQHADKVTIQ